MGLPDAQETYRTLRRALDKLELESCDRKVFIPDDCFDETFTYSLLSQCACDLLGSSGLDHIDELYANYRKTIAVLVRMTYEASFINFWRAGKNDHDLPLDRDTLESLDKDLWWPKFNKLQFQFLARTFDEETESQKWSDEYVLPIMQKEYRNRGAFSEVYKIKIYPKYDRLNYVYEGDEEQGWYALKQLKTSADTRVMERKMKEWQDEVSANALVRKQQHNGILPLLHSHQYGQHCNLIFPLASYNLKEFYSKVGQPPAGEPRLRFIEQISRLVPALGIIHQGEVDSTEGWIGFHRDLKPDNILVFGSTQRFMISDLGLMKFRKIKSGDREYSGEEWALGLSAYKAPECEVRGKRVGRGADIWSMGCILAEAITWCVCGKQGVDDFRTKRSTDDGEGYKSDLFFATSSSRQGKDTPRLKPEVLLWFEVVKAKAGFDPLICDSLGLVESMLKENPRGAKGRPTAEKLDCEFYTILKREAEREGVLLLIRQPSYYPRFDRRQALPFSYSRSMSLISPTQDLKRQRRSSAGTAEDFPQFTPPSLSNSRSDITLRPFKRRRDVSAFIHLKRLDTMFLIDDYVSSTPWPKLQKTLSKLAAIGTVWDQDGVDLAFIHSRQYFSCLGTSGDVMAALSRVDPSSECESSLSRRLDEILSEYVGLFRKDQFTKPLNMIVITSGNFFTHDEFEIKVMDWAKELDTMFAPKSQLGLQFVLVGCSRDNLRRFRRLDEDLFREYGVRDMVDATCYDPDEPEDPKIMEKIMCGGMIKTFDRMQEGSNLEMMAEE